MLSIIRYIKAHGLEKAVADFKLSVREYPHKVHLKYDTIESNFSNEEVRDCRGLILERGTWEVMSLSFRKFFNLGEGHAAEIDWDTARVYRKLDGSMIQVYTDWVAGEVFFSTTGTADGEAEVGNFHNYSPHGTFSELFAHAYKDTLERSGKRIDLSGRDLEIFVKAIFLKYSGMTLTFELCTPFNQVVTPHKESAVYLLAGRRLSDLKELDDDELSAIADDLKVPMAPVLFAKGDPDELKLSFEGMPYTEEGYVVRDAAFNRVKIKNPAYCTIHFFKESTAFWRIIDIVRGGDDNVNEYKATFPGREDEIDHLQSGWKLLVAELESYAADVSSDADVRAFIEYRNAMRIADKDISGTHKEKLLSVGYETCISLRAATLLELTELLGITVNEAKKLKRVVLQMRDDKEAERLRRSAAMRVMSWSKERGLQEHNGFLLSHIDGAAKPKSYLMGMDGKVLYKRLIKGFNKQ